MENCKGVVVILLLYFLNQFQESSSIQCVEMENSEVRIFPSLISFQANKIPFDPKNSSEGNYVAFSFKSLSALNKNAFVTFDSEHIIKIDLNGKSLKNISDGTFLSLTCLRYLTINNNSITELTWRTFEGLPNLKILELSGNELKDLPAMAFQNNERLEYLDLSSNKLKRLSPFSFANLTELKSLNLKKNMFVYIAPEVFLPLTNLENLDVSHNKLIELDAERWPLPNLKNLILSENFIRNFDATLNYTFKSLRLMNLSCNHLTQLNSFALKKTFHSLTILDLNHNYWRCDDLSKILHYLADAKVDIPARNQTTINEKGIDCENEESKLPFVFETSTDLVSSSTKHADITDPIEKNGTLNKQMNNLTVKSDEILLEISGIRKLLIFSLFFLVLVVIVYAMVQIGVFDGIQRKFSPRNGYSQPQNQDNYATLMS